MSVDKQIERWNFEISGLEFYSRGLGPFLDDIHRDLCHSKTGYICVTNMRTLDLARRDYDYAVVQKNALYRVPDGIALVWHAKLSGKSSFERISGPDLLHVVLSDHRFKNRGHYFFGSTEKNIQNMQALLPSKYPKAKFYKFISPPFQSIEEFEIDEILNDFNATGADFFWCGLGSPKQDYLISRLAEKANKGLFIGVGLAFDYCACSVKRAPAWLRRIGLEGIYRLIQQPQKISLSLVRRYLFSLWLIVSGVFR